MTMRCHTRRQAPACDRSKVSKYLRRQGITGLRSGFTYSMYSTYFGTVNISTPLVATFSFNANRLLDNDYIQFFAGSGHRYPRLLHRRRSLKPEISI